MPALAKHELYSWEGDHQPLRPPCVRTDDDAPLDIQILPNPPERTRLRIQIIDRHIEKPLDLTGMQIHGDDVIAARRLQHVGHQLGRDRRARLVLLVLPRVREVGDHGRDASRRGRLACVDHDQEFHEPVVDVAGRGGL